MQELIKRLSEIDVSRELGQARSDLEQEKNPREIDKIVRRIKTLSNLQSEGISPVDAFTQQKLVVPPSSFRAPMELADGNVVVPDVNVLLRDVGFAKETLEKAKKEKLPQSVISDMEHNLYSMANELSGFDPPTYNRKAQHNIWTYLSGKGTPKAGYIQQHVLRKRQDMTGRGTLTPDPTIDIDEIRLPYDMGMKIYEPFIKKELVDRGYGRKEADSMIKDQTDTAKDALRRVGRDRPVFINRAPSIRHTSVNTLWPIFTDGKDVGVPDLLAGLNSSLDFDGDSALCLCSLRLRSPLKEKSFIRLFFLDRIRLLFIMVSNILKEGKKNGKVSNDK